MGYCSPLLLVVSLLGLFLHAGGVELTFELPDNGKECFYQEIEKNVTSTLEFQVIFRIPRLTYTIQFISRDYSHLTLVEICFCRRHLFTLFFQHVTYVL